MNINDFLLNMRDNFNFPDDDKKAERQESLYKKEFSNYTSDKLDKVWQAVRRHHKSNFAPSIGHILEAMDKSDVKEYKKTNKYFVFNRCTNKTGQGELCGANYSLMSKFCPKCNTGRDKDNFVTNTVEVIYANDRPDNYYQLSGYCGICKMYQTNKGMQGANCHAWGSNDPIKKEGLNCMNCRCSACCNEKSLKGQSVE